MRGQIVAMFSTKLLQLRNIALARVSKSAAPVAQN